MRSLAELQNCARGHLSDYTDLSGPYAFPTYDSWWGRAPDRISPAEVFMANCLSLTLTASDVAPLFVSGDTPATRLLTAMRRVLDDVPAEGGPRFQDLGSIEDPSFRLFRSACAATDAQGGAAKVAQWTAVTVSKVLHRLRPHLVPVVDSVVRSFYAAPRNNPLLYERLHGDLSANRSWLDDLGEEFPTPDGRELSLLRTADIIVWHHQTTGCPR
jgi:hypothetical protein